MLENLFFFEMSVFEPKIQNDLKMILESVLEKKKGKRETCPSLYSGRRPTPSSQPRANLFLSPGQLPSPRPRSFPAQHATSLPLASARMRNRPGVVAQPARILPSLFLSLALWGHLSVSPSLLSFLLQAFSFRTPPPSGARARFSRDLLRV
jgi:hypothetical protein